MSSLAAFTLGFVAFLVALLAMPAVGQAASIYQYTGAFAGACGVSGEPACPSDGLFRQNVLPQRMAVHQPSGKLFVADPADNRVQVFTPTADGATFAYSITTPAPHGVAFDPVTQDLYVLNRLSTSPGPGKISKFNPDDADDPAAFTEDATFTTPVQGAGAGQVGGFWFGQAAIFGLGTELVPLAAQTLRGGIAVDPTTQDLLVVDTTRNELHRFDQDGTYLSSINGADSAASRPAFNSLMDVGVLPDGDIITADFLQLESSGALLLQKWRPRIDRYSPAGELQATLSAPGDNEIAMDVNTSSMALGVDQVSGEVFAASQVGNDWFLNPPGPPVEPGRIYQFEDDELVADFGIAGDALKGYKTGFAIKSSPARLYVLSTNAGGYLDTGGIPRIHVFDATIPPTADIDPIDLSQVTARTAWISGVVNPKGQQTSWRVQFRKKGVSGWPNETDPMPVGDEDDDFSVGTTVEGFEPNTEYEARIMAENAGGILVPTGLVEFRTKKTAPEIGLVLAGFLRHDSAEIRAEINPLNSQSGFWVEYGTTEAYGSRAPLAPATADAGSGGSAVIRVQALAGLLPGTEYHYRVVAENDEGQQNASGDQTFITLAADPGGLQGERGFELVTKQPAGDAHHPTAGEISVDGESFWYHYGATEVLMPGEDRPHKNVLARRGEDGWSYEFIDYMDPGHMNFEPSVYVSENMDSIFQRHGERQEVVGLDPDDQNGVADLYLRRGENDYLWISRSELHPVGGPGVDPEESAQTDSASSGDVGTAGGGSADAISADGSTVVFMSNRRLTEADQNASAPDSDVRRRAQSRLYKWRDGKLILLSQRPDGSQPTGIGVSLGGSTVSGSGTTATMNSPHAVSHDGSRVFWTDGTNMYLQIDGEVTRDLGPGLYRDAAPDGSRVYYTRAGRLYLRNVDEPTERDITGADQVQGVVAVAESGERIYYVSQAALSAEPSPLGLRPVAGQNNLYVTRLDSSGAPLGTRLIARLGSGQAEQTIWHFQSRRHPAAVSPDGAVLAFASASSLTGQPTAGSPQLYVYDDGKASFGCLSCISHDGAPPSGAVVGNVHVSGLSDEGTRGGWQARRLVAADGTVFFDTPTALLSGDKNEVRDVYEYRNGELRLLTAGRAGDQPSAVVNASRDGSSVAISAQTGFTPHDIDPGFYKFWVLRVGGGFPYTAPAPGCSGQGCEAPLSVPPALASPASAELRGRGNVQAEPERRGPALRVAAAKVRRGAAMRVRVRVPAAGRIVIAGGKVQRATRRAARAGNYAVGVRLSRAARRQLARRGRVRAAIRVTYRSGDGQSANRRVVVTFRKPARAGKGGR